MHVALTLYVLFAVWRWGDWKHWENYHTTMLYIAIGNLGYNFFTANYFLWRLDADVLSNHTLTEILYTIIIFPGSVLLFLCNFPSRHIDQFIHILKWIGIYGVVEFVLILTNSIDYQYGWNLKWSVFFDCIMFPMLLLHHKKPLLAYILSIPIAIFFIWWFNVPIHIPIENR